MSKDTTGGFRLVAKRNFRRSESREGSSTPKGGTARGKIRRSQHITHSRPASLGVLVECLFRGSSCETVRIAAIEVSWPMASQEGATQFARYPRYLVD